MNEEYIGLLFKCMNSAEADVKSLQERLDACERADEASNSTDHAAEINDLAEQISAANGELLMATKLFQAYTRLHQYSVDQYIDLLARELATDWKVKSHEGEIDDEISTNDFINIHKVDDKLVDRFDFWRVAILKL